MGFFDLKIIIRETEVYQKWFKKLKDKTVRIAIFKRLMKIRHFNHFGDAKPVSDNIYELRIHCGAGYRIYYTIRKKEVILLLCGGDKSSQKKDIEKAIKISMEV